MEENPMPPSETQGIYLTRAGLHDGTVFYAVVRNDQSEPLKAGGTLTLYYVGYARIFAEPINLPFLKAGEERLIYFIGSPQLAASTGPYTGHFRASFDLWPNNDPMDPNNKLYLATDVKQGSVIVLQQASHYPDLFADDSSS